MVCLSSSGVCSCSEAGHDSRFRTYQRQVVANCRALAEALMGLGYRVVWVQPEVSPWGGPTPHPISIRVWRSWPGQVAHSSGLTQVSQLWTHDL